MIVWLLVSAFLITGSAGWAASALSSLGYGLPQASASVRMAGMGMISLGMPDSLGLSLTSPAAWDGERTTRFGFSGNIKNMTLTDSQGRDTNDEAGFNGVGMAIPIGESRFFGLTLSPYTRMDYSWEVERFNELDSSTIKQEGTGGVSQALIAISTPVKPGIRLGFAVRAIFGKVDRHLMQSFKDSKTLSDSVSTSDRFSGIGWGLSYQWSRPEGLTTGLTLLGPVKMAVRRQVEIFTGGKATYDNDEILREKYDLPWDIRFGVGQLLGTHRIGFETGWQGWGRVKHPADLTDNFEDSFRFGLGWEWAPEYDLLDPIWRSFIYRSGIYSRDHYHLSGSGNQSRRIALTAGISIPYFENRSRIDFAFEIGWEGNKDKDGVTERSIVFAIGFNHSQEWFVARRKRN